jgi:hypothetical protein
VADHPLGPWRNAVVGDKPLIDGKFKPGYHMIDAEAFIDDDGAAYLYWGSGWNWKNGKCFAVKLKADMVSFDSEVMDVTPARYFEAPLMIKRHGKYFLMYSDGITVEDTYEVHYAVGDGPLGPFTLGKGSPVLSTDKSTNVISPGHHTILHHGGQDYIVYHRHSIPFVKDAIGRQMCMDVIRFNAEGTIDRVEPTHEGPAVVRDRLAGAGLEVIAAKATASSSAGEAGGVHGPGRVVDDNYATRWAAEPGADGAWIKLDLGSVQRVSAVRILPEYAWKRLRFAVETSEDGQQWHTVADFTAEGGGAQGSPIVVSGPAGGPADGAMQAQYIRLTFPADVKGNRISLWEVQAVR